MQRIALLAVAGLFSFGTAFAFASNDSAENEGYPSLIVDVPLEQAMDEVSQLDARDFFVAVSPRDLHGFDAIMRAQTTRSEEGTLHSELRIADYVAVEFSGAFRSLGPNQTEIDIRANVPANFLSQSPEISDDDREQLAILGDLLATEFVLSRITGQSLKSREAELKAQYGDLDFQPLVSRIEQALMQEYGEDIRRAERIARTERAHDYPEPQAESDREAAERLRRQAVLDNPWIDDGDLGAGEWGDGAFD